MQISFPAPSRHPQHYPVGCCGVGLFFEQFEGYSVDLLELFHRDKAPAISLSAKEIAILEAVRRYSATGVCAADLQSSIGASIGKEPRLATLYGAISDLERKGLIESIGSAVPEKSGRPRRLFKLTRTGALAHELGVAMVSGSSSPVLV